jgi:hypothetical protein
MNQSRIDRKLRKIDHHLLNEAERYVRMLQRKFFWNRVRTIYQQLREDARCQLVQKRQK